MLLFVSLQTRILLVHKKGKFSIVILIYFKISLEETSSFIHAQHSEQLKCVCITSYYCCYWILSLLLFLNSTFITITGFHCMSLCPLNHFANSWRWVLFKKCQSKLTSICIKYRLAGGSLQKSHAKSGLSIEGSIQSFDEGGFFKNPLPNFTKNVFHPYSVYS